MKPCIALTGSLLAAGLIGCNGGDKPAPGPAPAPSTAAPATSAPSTAAAPAPAPSPTAGTDPSGNGGDNPGGDAPSGDGGGHEHADMVSSDLGVLDVGGFELRVTQFGEIEAGDELALNVTGEIPSGAGLYAWIADAKGNPLGAPADATKEDGVWHFHLMQDESEEDPVWIYLRIRGGGKDVRARMLLAGADEPPPNGGSSGGLLPAGDDEAVDPVGTVEAVWDPATGTLKLWFYTGPGFSTPMPIDESEGVIALLDESPLELKVKDAAKGLAEITGEDALKDADLTPMLVVMFTSGGKELKSELLVLESE